MKAAEDPTPSAQPPAQASGAEVPAPADSSKNEAKEDVERRRKLIDKIMAEDAALLKRLNR